MDSLFYSLWRNTIFLNEIRNRVCRDLVINIDLEYLNANHKYISLLTVQDKLDYNIYFKLYINNREELINYHNNQYKHLIDDIVLCNFNLQPVGGIIRPEENYIDAEMIGNGVRRILLYADKNTSIKGTLPSSITELSLNEYDNKWSYVLHIGNRYLDAMVSSLPNLRKLMLPPNFQVTLNLQLPSTLVELNYKTGIDNVRKIVFSTTPTPVLENKSISLCEVIINDLDDLAWVHDKPRFTRLDINRLEETIPKGGIPEHVTNVKLLHSEIIVVDGTLPLQLQELVCYNSISISLIKPLVHLKCLYLQSLEEQLVKDMLPNTLQELYINQYNLPLLPDVLPRGLKKLRLSGFDKELQIGVLPQSLKRLQLQSFNCGLKPFVLPSSLTWLDLNNFNRILVKHSLPCSLKVLKLYWFNGSFDLLDPMPELSILQTHVLHPSITKLLCKHIDDRVIKIYFRSVDQSTNLRDTSIKHLHLLSLTRTLLSSRLIPKQIKTLRLSGIDIKSSNLIPKSCLYLETVGDVANLISSTTKLRPYDPDKYI